MKKQHWRANRPMRLMALLLLLCFSLKGIGQDITVTGSVISDSAVALENVSVVLKADVNRAVTTDAAGFEKQEIAIQGEGKIRVVLKRIASALDDVVVVSFGGKQKKSSMVSAITSINPKELKGPTSNLTTMLAGRVS
eukprot:gene2654-3611_t